MLCKSEAGATPRCAQPAWYKVYFDAMVERDRRQALLEIERARHAIEDRAIELRQVAPSSPREKQDMVHALTYLGILLMYMSTESGGLLWD
jgi:hypothetical protein